MPQKGHLEAKLLHVVTDLKLMSDFKLIFDWKNTKTVNCDFDTKSLKWHNAGITEGCWIFRWVSPSDEPCLRKKIPIMMSKIMWKQIYRW
jgi:hypothetical protein